MRTRFRGHGARLATVLSTMFVFASGAGAVSAQDPDDTVVTFPYHLEIVTEASATAVVGGLWALQGEPRDFGFESEIAALRRGDVNPFDRLTVGMFSRGARVYSDWSRDLLLVGAAAVLFSEVGWNREFPVLLVMTAETGLLTAALTSTVKSRAQRLRPYAFNDRLSVEERADFAREEGDVLESFYSGHTAAAFAAAMFATTVWNDIHAWDGTRASRLRLAALGLAGTTALARVAGGAHHPTDVIAGAVIGAAIGWAVPWLHRRERQGRWRLVASGSGIGLQVLTP